MAIFRNFSFNVLAFSLGTFFFGLFVLFFSQYGNLTASVSDAFVEDDFLSEDAPDIYLSSTSESISVFSNREIYPLPRQSLRISFLYDASTIDTSSLILSSDYLTTLSFQEGVGTVIVVFDDKKISSKEVILTISSSVFSSRDQIVVQSIELYNESFIESLIFDFSPQIHSPHII